jgi:hypothetical protein
MVAVFNNHHPIVMMVPSVVAHLGVSPETMMVAVSDDNGFGAGN